MTAIVIAFLLVGAGVTAVVLSTSDSGNASPIAAGTASSAPTLPADTEQPTEDPPSGSRPLPPPTPTGTPYNDDEPAIGSCVDLARRPTGVAIYKADCDDPAANLILDNIQTNNCADGFFGLKSLSKKIMCFTYNLQAGDCIDMNIPRRASCSETAPLGGKPKATVSSIRPGQQDGIGCTNPKLFLRVGKADHHRGIACLTSTTQQTATTAVSR